MKMACSELKAYRRDTGNRVSSVFTCIGALGTPPQPNGAPHRTSLSRRPRSLSTLRAPRKPTTGRAHDNLTYQKLLQSFDSYSETIKKVDVLEQKVVVESLTWLRQSSRGDVDWCTRAAAVDT